MIYPNNFEYKIGFDEIRALLKERCLSTLGKEKVEALSFSTDAAQVKEWLLQVREFRLLLQQEDSFPMQFFFDVRESISRIRLEGTHLEENEVWDLRRSLETISNIVKYLNYISRIVKRWLSETGALPKLRLIIIYTGDVARNPSHRHIDFGCLTLTLNEGFLCEIDGEAVYNEIRDKLQAKQPLSQQDIMRLVILPLSFRGTGRRRIPLRFSASGRLHR